MAPKRPAELEPDQLHGNHGKSRRVEGGIKAPQPLLEWCPFVPQLCPFHLVHEGDYGIVTLASEIEESLEVPEPMPERLDENLARPALCNEKIQPTNTELDRRPSLSAHQDDAPHTINPRLLLLQEPFAQEGPAQHQDRVAFREPAKHDEVVERRPVVQHYDQNQYIQSQAADFPMVQNSQEIDKTDGDSTNKFPYSCNVCHKEFQLKSSMNRHEKAFHSTGEDSAFACTFCNKRFSRNDSLLAHARKHHKVELPHVARRSRGQTSATTSSAPV
ncbi:uncharacterized protein BKA78DRAFT_295576 [Phyllosticta capitalensis]